MKSKGQTKLVETPLDVLFTKAINIAHENSKNPAFYSTYSNSPAFEYSFDKSLNQEKTREAIKHGHNSLVDNLVDDDEDRIMPTPCEKVLKNVRIYVSRKLVKQQTELYEQAILLGAEFLWNYDESSTHFIYSGKLTDTNKELKIAKEQKKHIVSPNWLLACKEQRQHVDESLYALSMTSSAKSLIQKRSSLTRSSTLTPKAMTPAKSDVLPKVQLKKTRSWRTP